MKMLAKLQKRLQEGKKDNKGFSLVELIIVIAIMAILIGIVGMNIIPQIENARQSKDLQVLSAYLTESVQALTQNADKCTGTTFTLTITPGSGTCAVTPNTDPGAAAIERTFKELAGLNGTAVTFESNAGKNIGTVVIALSLTNGSDAASLTLTASDTAGADVQQLVSNANPLTSK